MSTIVSPPTGFTAFWRARRRAPGPPAPAAALRDRGRPGNPRRLAAGDRRPVPAPQRHDRRLRRAARLGRPGDRASAGGRRPGGGLHLPRGGSERRPGGRGRPARRRAAGGRPGASDHAAADATADRRRPGAMGLGEVLVRRLRARGPRPARAQQQRFALRARRARRPRPRARRCHRHGGAGVGRRDRRDALAQAERRRNLRRGTRAPGLHGRDLRALQRMALRRLRAGVGRPRARDHRGARGNAEPHRQVAFASGVRDLAAQAGLLARLRGPRRPRRARRRAGHRARRGRRGRRAGRLDGRLRRRPRAGRRRAADRLALHARHPAGQRPGRRVRHGPGLRRPHGLPERGHRRPQVPATGASTASRAW